MLRRLMLLGFHLLALLSIVSLVACAGAPAPTPTATAKATSAPAPAATAKPTSAPAPAATAKPAAEAAKPAAAPAPSRQEALEAAAKQEKTVVFWGTAGMEAEKYLAKFKARYPWLEVKVMQATGQEVAEKVLAESRAGRVSADVLDVAEDVAVSLRAANLLDKYDWPNMASWDLNEQAGNGFYSSFAMGHNSTFYNTNLIPPSEAPASWDDLKNPKWKGKVAISTASGDAPLQNAYMWGTKDNLNWDKSFQFWKDVFKATEPIVVKGFTNPITLLGAGEFALFPVTSGDTAIKLKLTKGLPIDVAKADKVAGAPGTVSIVKGAPHPNAAKLLADYLTSTEGQMEYAAATYNFPIDPKAAAQSEVGRPLVEKGIKAVRLPAELYNDTNVKKSEDFFNGLLGLQ